MRRGVGRESERSVGRSVPTISRVTNRENGPTGILRASRTFQCAWCDRCTGKVQTRSGLSHFFADRDRGGSATLENRACASATRSFHRQTDSQTVELASLGGWSTLAYEDSKLYGECRSPVNEGGGEERNATRYCLECCFTADSNRAVKSSIGALLDNGSVKLATEVRRRRGLPGW